MLRCSFIILLLASTALCSGQTQSACEKNVAFASAQGGMLILAIPSFAPDWIKKNQQRYHKMCFSEQVAERQSNYLVVFATSLDAFNGLQPHVVTSTRTDPVPVSGSGTVTDNSGVQWVYTYAGTESRTTTTVTTQYVPYTVLSKNVFMMAFDQRGVLVSDRSRSKSTMYGGTASQSLGYNLGSTIKSFHYRERLLSDVMNDIAGQK